MAPTAKFTQEEAIKQVAQELNGPVSLETLVDRVLERKPSAAKGARSALRGIVRMQADSLGLLFTDAARKNVVPPAWALRGMRFRHVISKAEAGSQSILWEQSDDVFLPGLYRPLGVIEPGLQLVDAGGRPISSQKPSIAAIVDALLGRQPAQGGGYKMPDFFYQQHVKAGDSLLLTVEQFDPARWRMEHEPQARRDQAAITRRNQELMDLLFAMLEGEKRKEMWVRELVRSAHAQLADPYGYPGDPWPLALAQDGRMRVNEIFITYADVHRFDDLARFFAFDPQTEAFDDETTADDIELPPLPEAAANRIYTLKVTATYRQNLWRRVEVQGGQMLAELNDFLVDEFMHEIEHLGGFWRLVRRGAGKRYREVEIATVEPGSGGEGSELRLAELDLQEGDTLKWVYDFGDWFEYKLLLERITEPAIAEEAVAEKAVADAADYPRVVGANKPKIRYCDACQARGKQVVATMVCYDCSQEQGKDVMVCEECVEQGLHDDHDLEDWVS